MTTVRVHATHLTLVMCLVATSWLAPTTAGAEIPLQSYVRIIVSDGITGFTHTAPVGPFMIMEVAIEFASFGFLDAPKAESYPPVDIYVGLVLPDGRHMSWVGDPRGATFVTGPAPVPLFAGVVPSVGTFYAQRHPNLATPGWWILYGLVVRAGANPLDPREWAGWNPAEFYPLLVVPR